MIILTEYAKRLNRIGDRLEAISDPIIMHLLKIFYFPKEKELVTHWIGEISDFLYRIDLVKGTNKYPKSSFIYSNLWKDSEDTFDRDHYLRINKINKKYARNYGEIYCDPRAKDFCREYMLWLSTNLSKKGYVEDYEVENKIHSLMKEFDKE